MKNRIGFILGAVFACTVSALAGNAKDLKLTSPNGGTYSLVSAETDFSRSE